MLKEHFLLNEKKVFLDRDSRTVWCKPWKNYGYLSMVGKRSCKGRTASILGSVAIRSLLPSHNSIPLKVPTDRMERNAWLCSSKPSLVDTKIHILCNFQVSQNITFIF